MTENNSCEFVGDSQSRLIIYPERFKNLEFFRTDQLTTRDDPLTRLYQSPACRYVGKQILLFLFSGLFIEFNILHQHIFQHIDYQRLVNTAFGSNCFSDEQISRPDGEQVSPFFFPDYIITDQIHLKIRRFALHDRHILDNTCR